MYIVFEISPKKCNEGCRLDIFPASQVSGFAGVLRFFLEISLEFLDNFWENIGNRLKVFSDVLI